MSKQNILLYWKTHGLQLEDLGASSDPIWHQRHQTVEFGLWRILSHSTLNWIHRNVEIPIILGDIPDPTQNQLIWNHWNTVKQMCHWDFLRKPNVWWVSGLFWRPRPRVSRPPERGHRACTLLCAPQREFLGFPREARSKRFHGVSCIPVYQQNLICFTLWTCEC